MNRYSNLLAFTSAFQQDISRNALILYFVISILDEGQGIPVKKLPDLIPLGSKELMEATLELIGARVITRRKVEDSGNFLFLNTRIQGDLASDNYLVETSSPESIIQSNLSLLLRNKAILSYILLSSEEVSQLPRPASRSVKAIKSEEGRKISNKPTPLKKSKPNKEMPFVPESVKQVIDFWNNLGLKKCNYGPTKVFRETINKIKKAMRGTLYTDYPELKVTEKFSADDIIESIKNFHQAINDDRRKPARNSRFWLYLKDVPLTQFMLHPLSSNPFVKSLFISYLDPAPFIHFNPNLENKYPAMVAAMEDYYRENVLSRLNVPEDPEAKSHFIKASHKLKDFLFKNKGKLLLAPAGIVTDRDIALLFCECFNYWDPIKLKPYHFSSDKAFSDSFPRHLASEGLAGEFFS